MSRAKSKTQDFCGIYSIVNFVERKFYVGSSVQVLARKHRHIKTLSEGRSHARRMQEDWNRLGPDGFDFIVLESGLDRNDLQERENFWMGALGSVGVYNSCRAGSRQDDRYHELSSLDLGGWVINVGDSVLVGRVPSVVEKILVRKNSHYIKAGSSFLFENQFGHIRPSRKRLPPA